MLCNLRETTILFLGRDIHIPLVLRVNYIMFRILCTSINGSSGTGKCQKGTSTIKPVYSGQQIFSVTRKLFIPFIKLSGYFRLQRIRILLGMKHRSSEVILLFQSKAGVNVTTPTLHEGKSTHYLIF
jgi:hypothetical protein